MEIYKEEKFVTWANNWLNGSDRSTESAKASYTAASYNAYTSYIFYYVYNICYCFSLDATNNNYTAINAAYTASSAADLNINLQEIINHVN